MEEEEEDVVDELKPCCRASKMYHTRPHLAPIFPVSRSSGHETTKPHTLCRITMSRMVSQMEEEEELWILRWGVAMEGNSIGSALS